MSNKKFVIKYQRIQLFSKNMFIFVNHKISTICWAKIKNNSLPCNIVTFDSHNDFYGGLILDGRGIAFGSKYLSHLPHFSQNKGFLRWDPRSDIENKEIIEKGHRFFTVNSDNFIDIAFMKNIVKNVFSYYLYRSCLETDSDVKECDDINRGIHHCSRADVKDFVMPNESFILDIDLDFFVQEDDELSLKLIPNNQIIEYLKLLKKLAKNSFCIGITIALEPNFTKDLQKLCENFSNIFEFDIKPVVLNLLGKEGYNL